MWVFTSFPSIGKQTQEATIEVVDMVGNTIYTDAAPINNGTMSKEINLNSSVANGMYMLRIKNAEVNETLKFTLSR